MAQPSVVSYFHNRKRAAAEDSKLIKAKKVLVLDKNLNCEKITNEDKKYASFGVCEGNEDECIRDNSTYEKKKINVDEERKVIFKKISEVKQRRHIARPRKKAPVQNQKDIQSFLNNILPKEIKNNIEGKEIGSLKLSDSNVVVKETEENKIVANKTNNLIENEKKETKNKKKEFSELNTKEETEEKNQEIQQLNRNEDIITESNYFIPSSPYKIKQNNIERKFAPSSPCKINAMDKLNCTGKELSLKEIKSKLSRSSRLAELKASLNRFQKANDKLKEIEKKTEKNTKLQIKEFKTLELEVHLSPQKVQSPEKIYLSPKKNLTAKKNLFNAQSTVLASPKKEKDLFSKQSLTLPYKYRYLAEIFRSIDTVCQIIYNRKETITFKKLKPAVEEMLKRNLYEKHLAQIKFLYPESFEFKQEKLRAYGTGNKQENWELVIEPKIDSETITSELLLQRRRQFYNLLIEKLKVYHNEFLLTLEPPLIIPKEKLTRWHPEFDLEKVPDIEEFDLPKSPTDEKIATGREVLEKVKTMFNCNKRMEEALEKLKNSQEQNSKEVEEKPKQVNSILKGIPKALLQKVREKQAALALQNMTRSVDKEKELVIHSRLPEIARFTRNLFVAEKKSVLALDIVTDKLSNSFKVFLTKNEIEEHLKLIAKHVPEWIVLHNIRNCIFVKISKSSDLNIVLSKLESIAKEKLKA